MQAFTCYLLWTALLQLALLCYTLGSLDWMDPQHTPTSNSDQDEISNLGPRLADLASDMASDRTWTSPYALKCHSMLGLFQGVPRH